MVKSKRNQVVNLTKVAKNPGEKKKKLVANIRESVDKYNYIYLFTYENMRNNLLKKVRTEWGTSKFLFGKNKVLSIGLGKSDSDELKTNLHLVSQQLEGECGLFFTNEPIEKVMEFFKNYTENDYPRAGFVPSETITLPEGPINMTHSMETYLRNLGLPTVLKNGVITLERDYNLCEEGEAITPEQSRLLQLFEHKISEFKLNIKGYYHNNVYTTTA
ncbi:hypothetical protein CYY_003820 [Polysphondylium violaceum]|uniref:Ribosome assembly factor mrt4 n=1 Tax=Polysphondylium violaceum TaxID=133409 RepID=A0A8J4UZU7_9MYCE|nr:hypothetical protein CYY_003820 [Polysphondylium violaceum]